MQRVVPAQTPLTNKLRSMLMMQDTAGAGRHGGSLVLSTCPAGLSGPLQDWLTISSTGLSTFSGDLLSRLSTTAAFQLLTCSLACLVRTFIESVDTGCTRNLIMCALCAVLTWHAHCGPVCYVVHVWRCPHEPLCKVLRCCLLSAAMPTLRCVCFRPSHVGLHYAVPGHTYHACCCKGML